MVKTACELTTGNAEGLMMIFIFSLLAVVSCVVYAGACCAVQRCPFAEWHFGVELSRSSHCVCLSSHSPWFRHPFLN
jgi:hypothetical protein